MVFTGSKLTFNYNRVNQEGEYNSQRVKNTAFGTGIWVDSPSKTYDGFYYYISNSFIQENNGGISDYLILDSNLTQIRSAVPVYTQSGLTTYRERIFRAVHHINLYDSKDSLKLKPRLVFTLGTMYKNLFNKYVDEQSSSSPVFYEGFNVDDRGVRNFVGINTLENEAWIRWRLLGSSKKPTGISAGITHRINRINQEPELYTTNEIFLNGKINIGLKDRVEISGDAYVGVLDALGEYKIEGLAALRAGNLGELEFGILSYQRKPNLLESRLYVSQQLVWDNDFSNINYSHFYGLLRSKKFGLTARLEWKVVDNFIYYDQQKMAQQINSSVSVRQILIQKDQQLGFAHVSALFALQQTDEDRLALPSWILQGSGYVTANLFKKKLKVRLGADVRITNSYSGVKYFALPGQFHLDNSREIPLYPAIDAYSVFNLGKLQVFLKWENINAWWSDDVFLQVVDYPQFESYFRFGFYVPFFN